MTNAQQRYFGPGAVYPGLTGSIIGNVGWIIRQRCSKAHTEYGPAAEAGRFSIDSPVYNFFNPFVGKIHILMCWLLLACVWNASAREISDEEISTYSLDELLKVEVYTTAQYVQTLSQAPATASIITDEEIRAFGYQTLSDILRGIPGLYVTYDRNYSYLGSRGYGSVGDWNSRILFLVDGYRVNENVYDSTNIGHDFPVDIGLIKRVEYIAGPGAAMLFGNNAIFGVINIITKTGVQMDGAELVAGGGSAASRYGRASFGKQFDNGLDMLVSASRYRSDGRNIDIPEFGGTAVDLDYEYTDRLFAKLGYKNFTLEMAHSDRKKGIPNASYGQVFNDPRTYTIDRNSFVDLNYNLSLGVESALSARLYYNEYKYKGDYVYDDAEQPPPDPYIFYDKSHGRQWGLDLKFVSRQIGRHKLLLGADFKKDLAKDQKDGYTGVEPPVLDDKRTGEHWGVFFHDEITLGERLTLDVGGRFDAPATSDNEFNPRVGLIYKITPRTKLKALYGSAFRPPNVYELYYDSDDVYLSNSNLDAERIKTYELIAEHQGEYGTKYIATLFHSRINGLIDYETQPGDDGVIDTDDDIFVLENIQNVKVTGVELRFEKLFQTYGNLQASYTYQNARGLGGWLMNSPHHLAKLNWRIPLFKQMLHAGMELQYTSPRRTYAGTEIGSNTLAHVTLTSDKLIRSLDLSLSVRNLFDRHYSDPAAYFHAPLDRINQDGRNLWLQGTYRF